jgi:transposase
MRESGLSSVKVAEYLGVSRSWVDSLRRRKAAGQSLEPMSRANHRTTLAHRAGDRIKAQVAAKPGTTLADLKNDLGLQESIWAIWLALKELRLSLKKKHSTPRSGAAPTSSSRGRLGKSSKRASTRDGLSSSTKPSARRR